MTALPAIRQAAAALFARKGYQATTMQDVAGAAGISKATLYRYVSGKEALRDLVAGEVPAGDLEARDARARILDAALRLVTRQGFARTTLEEIASAACVSKSAIYWHFKGKDDLTAALIGAYTPFPKLATLLAEAGDRSFTDLAPEIYAIISSVLGERVDFLRAAFPEAQTNPELAAILLGNVIGPLAQTLGTRMQRDMGAGELRPVPPLLVLQALMAPLLFHLLTRDVLRQQLGIQFDLDEAQSVFLQIFFDGLRPRLAATPSPEGS
jgi:AcrR family transcriptional regulator